MNFIKTIAALSLLTAGIVCTSCGEDDPEISVQDTPPVTNPGQTEQTEKVVDLGLSVKWATCNLGANFPEEIGDYYAWGETASKNEYTEGNYFDSNYSKFTLTGNRSVCGTAWDAAYVKLGKDWRMPTAAEIKELVSKCTWTEETVNGIMGQRGIASNGKSIFLPYTGMFAGSKIELPNGMGCYWGGELYTDALRSNKRASELSFFSGSAPTFADYYRWEGMAIRPVYIGTEFGNDDNQSSDDEEEPVVPPSDEIEDNLPSEAKSFVGFWENPDYYNSDVRPHLYCSADGICFVASQYYDTYKFTWRPTLAQDYWAYDNDSKTLTAGSFIFTVTLSNQKTWKGIYKKGSKTYNESFNKVSNLVVAQFLMGRVGNWLSEENVVVDLTKYTITEDANEEDYTFNYTKGTETGTVTIKNPFYLSKISLIFKGSFNGVLHRSWN